MSTHSQDPDRSQHPGKPKSKIFTVVMFVMFVLIAIAFIVRWGLTPRVVS